LYNAFLPSFTPLIGSLSVTSSSAGQYSLVYINGNNFFPNGTTYVNFGQYKNIPIVYYGSFNISFVVPTPPSANTYPETYTVYVTLNTNSNFSPFLLYSNPVTYTITS
jgi:hypothetical protein